MENTRDTRGARDQVSNLEEEEMPNPGFSATLVEVPPGATPDMIRELCLLGLTEETSLGILRVLMRSDVQPASLDLGDW